MFCFGVFFFTKGRTEEPGTEAELGGRGCRLPDSRGQDRTRPNMGGHRRLRQRHTAAAAQIPSFPASTPKLLSQRVYSALLALDVSAPSEPVGGGGGGGGWMEGGGAMAGGMAEGRRQDEQEEKEGEERRGGSGVIRERSQISKKGNAGGD